MNKRLSPDAARRAAAPFYSPGPQQQTRRTLLQRSHGTYGRTDGRTPQTPPHTMRAVSVNI